MTYHTLRAPEGSGKRDRIYISRAKRNIDWIQRHCYIPEGKFIGQKLKVAPFMRDDFRAIYDNPHGTRRAILTRGRKNAKTVEAALILLLHLCGPESIHNGQLYSTALSREQAAVLFALASKIIRLSPTLRERIIIKDSAKQLVFPYPGRGTVYRALSAEASTAFGVSPVLVVHDELGQMRGPRSALYEAMETATAAQENPLSVIISTQAPTDADLLSVLIDDAKGGHDPKTVLRLAEADLNLDPFSIEAIRQANPAFDLFMNKDEVLSMAEDARRMPSREAEYRNLILNQRVEAENPFISRSTWDSCGTPVLDSFKGKPIYAGLDLSSSNDLTALVLIAAHESKWHVKPIFWLPSEGLMERARKDHVEYDLWHQQGYLETTPGKSIEYEWVAEYLRSLFDNYDIRQIAFDRYNFRHLKSWLEKVGFGEAELAKFVEFGQGYIGMSPALRTLESALLSNKIAHANHPVLSMCAANAVVTTDPAGNRKLDKKRARGRIDGMVALAMAVSVATTEELAPPPPEYSFYIM